MTIRNTDVTGSGGGKKSSGTSADNTLRSTARARLVEAVSEGPILGLVDGAKSIYFDQTPVQNADGSFNFKNVDWEEHKGLPDDSYFNGHTDVGTVVQVDAKVENSLGPIQRTLVEPNADAIRVIVRVNSLFKVNSGNGTMQTNSVTYGIDVRSAGGTWARMITKALVNEKCMSPVQIAHRIKLPEDGSPWDIRVTRDSVDEVDDKNQSDIFFEGYVVLVEGKFTYPHTAAIAMEVNAEDMGSSIPARSYHVKGRMIEVPVNYDPVTRAYTGIWNGTFKTEYTNNPAWIFYDMVMNDRFGMGEFVDQSGVNKWSLYTIAQYCDGLVKTGYKDDLGADIMEPRYTFNGVINGRDEAFYVLQSITTSWRGMGYWSLGQLFATADMPSDPISLVAPANVVNGEFVYSSTATKARHSVILVKWNDPSDFYRPAVELVIDDDAMRRYGWREKQVQLQGCTSRGLARRYGRWILDVEQNESETVSYRAGFDHLDAKPGDIIAAADPRRALVRLGGRVVSHIGDLVTIDGDFEMVAGETYDILLTKPDATVERLALTSVSGRVLTVAATAIKAAPNAMFVITGTEVAPRQYRVLSVTEASENVFKVTALQHDPLKYDRVERGFDFEPISYSRVPEPVPVVANLVVTETNFMTNTRARSTLVLSWSPPSSVVVRNYSIYANTPEKTNALIGVTPNNSIEFEVLDPGVYTFSVRTIDVIGRESEPQQISYTVKGDLGYGLAEVRDLELVTGAGLVFEGVSPEIVWRNYFPTSTVVGALETDGVSPLYSHNIIKVYRGDNGALLRTARSETASYRYDIATNRSDNGVNGPARALRFVVTCFDKDGRFSADKEITVSNPQPAVIAPIVESSGETINVTWNPGVEDDIAGTIVWIEKNSTFDPLTTTPRFDGPGGFMAFDGDPITEYFVRTAVYDSFSKFGLNISAAQSVVTGAGLVLDEIAPPVPVGLTLGSISTSDGTARLTASWTASTADDFSYYEVQIREGAGNYVSNQTPLTYTEHNVTSGASYGVRLRAVDRLGNASGYSAEVTISGAVDTVAPGTVTGLTAQGGFGAVWLSWTASAASDLSYYEVYESASAVAPLVATVATFTATANAASRTGLTDAATFNYWVRAVDTSGNKSAWSVVAQATTVYAGVENYSITPEKLVTGEVITLTAQIKNAIISNAKISELSAAKLIAGTALTSSLTVNGTALSTVNTNAALGAQDPATRINAAVTQIDPGKIVISGATTLADWRRGGDETKIEGGAVAANTITANKLTIGNRGVTTSLIRFEAGTPNPNDLSWSSGVIRWYDDTGSPVETTVAAGLATWTAGTVYIYWAKGASVLSQTTSLPTAMNEQNLVLASYGGGFDLTADYGRTVIDGDSLRTNILEARHSTIDFLSAISINASQITSGAIYGDQIIVNNRLDFEEGGALAVGKGSYLDPADGFYIGNPVGSKAYAFYVTRASGTPDFQEVTFDEDTIELVNPTLKVGLSEGSSVAFTTVGTFPETQIIPVEFDLIDLKAIGAGGGGGNSSETANALRGPTGGQTVLEVGGLNGGGLPVVFSYTLAGGEGGPFGKSSLSASGFTLNGESSDLGQGGAAGYKVTGYEGGIYYLGGENGMGNGAGGGAAAPLSTTSSEQGRGGKAGEILQLQSWSFSANGIVSGKYIKVYEVGAAGAITQTSSGAGMGSNGIVQLTWFKKTLSAIPLSSLVTSDWTLLHDWTPNDVVLKTFDWQPEWDKIRILIENIGFDGTSDASLRYRLLANTQSKPYGTGGPVTWYYTASNTRSTDFGSMGTLVPTSATSRISSDTQFENLRKRQLKKFTQSYVHNSIVGGLRTERIHDGFIQTMDGDKTELDREVGVDGFHLFWSTSAVFRASVGRVRIFGADRITNAQEDINGFTG